MTLLLTEEQCVTMDKNASQAIDVAFLVLSPMVTVPRCRQQLYPGALISKTVNPSDIARRRINGPYSRNPALFC